VKDLSEVLHRARSAGVWLKPEALVDRLDDAADVMVRLARQRDEAIAEVERLCGELADAVAELDWLERRVPSWCAAARAALAEEGGER
jgi:phage host-nuclease inhibitor protein Gam